MRRIAIIALSAAALAGCGGGSYGGGGSSSSSGSATAASSNAAPTLYTFAKDTTGKSNCTGACAKNWPPAAANAKPPKGVDKSKLSTIMRSDGTKQLALDGHPLYTFVGDKKPGDANGDGVNAFGGVWKNASSQAKSTAPAPSRSYGGY